MKNIVDLVTPFDFDNLINYEELKIILDYLLKNDVDGIVVLGRCSESISMSFEEKIELVKFVLGYIDKRVITYVNLNGNIHDLIDFDELVKDLDFDYYIVEISGGNDTGIVKYYSYLADKLSHKIMVYNDKEFNYDVMKSLSYHPNIVGTIINTNNVRYLIDLLKINKEKLDIYLADDYLILVGISLGVKGIISVIGNAYPNFISEVSVPLESSDKEFLKYEQIIKGVYSEQIPVALKYLMKIKGSISDKVRLPNGVCSKKLKRKIEEDYLNL